MQDSMTSTLQSICRAQQDRGGKSEPTTAAADQRPRDEQEAWGRKQHAIMAQGVDQRSGNMMSMSK